MKIYAHRGSSGYIPENSLQAFETAFCEHHADGIELDVHLSSDHIPIVMHDFNLQRTSDGFGKIGKMSYRQLRSISLKGFDCHTPIPTLEEVLTLVKEYQKEINIELKAGSNRYPDIEKIVLEMVHRFDLTDQTIVSSFDHRALQTTKSIDPNVRIGVLTNKPINTPEDYLKSIGASHFHPHHKIIDRDLVRTLHGSDIKVVVFTPNSADEMKSAIDNEADIIITNYPDLAYKIKNQHQTKKEGH